MYLENYVYEAPRNEIEEKLCKVWEEAFGTNKIGINDNFFELGGDSFKALRVISKSAKKYTLVELYKNPTIKMLSSVKSTVQTEILTRLTDNLEESDISLICLPYGGRTGIAYKELANSISMKFSNYTVYAVNPPGHDIGNKDEEMKDIFEIARLCVDEIKKQVKGKIVLYGHCVGATLAFEIAHLLENEGSNVHAIYMGGALAHKLGILGRSALLEDPWDNYSDDNIKELLTRVGGLDGTIE